MGTFRKRGRSSVEASKQFVQRHAGRLIDAHRAAAEPLHQLHNGHGRTVGQGLAALSIHADRMRRVDDAVATLAASLLLGGATREAVADALGVHRNTLPHRFAACPEAARIAAARGRDLEQNGNGWWGITTPTTAPSPAATTRRRVPDNAL